MYIEWEATQYKLPPLIFAMKTIIFNVVEVRDLQSNDGREFKQLVLEKEIKKSIEGCDVVRKIRAYFSCDNTTKKEGDTFTWDDENFMPIQRVAIERDGKELMINQIKVKAL